MQTCRLCGTEKPLDDYYFRSDSETYRTECKECMIERHRYKKLGICNVKYDEMLTKQKGKCDICKCKLNSSRYTKLCVDHCHKTKKVRGLLCVNCNTAIGLMKDSSKRLESAISYLKKHDEDIV